ncbi:hypothetical protein D9M69_368630 [compost metagenome]
MPSITPMMSTTLPEACLISPMVPTTWLTMVPPRTAMSEAPSARWLAWRALSALWRTVLVSCSMLAAVSCSEAACSSLRRDRSALPAAICLAAPAIESAEPRMLPIAPVRRACMRCIANSTLCSSPGRTSTWPARSPSAMRPAICAVVAGSPPSWRCRLAETRTITSDISAPTPSSRPSAFHNSARNAASMSSRYSPAIKFQSHGRKLAT